MVVSLSFDVEIKKNWKFIFNNPHSFTSEEATNTNNLTDYSFKPLGRFNNYLISSPLVQNIQAVTLLT